jgi:hypothetical protein
VSHPDPPQARAALEQLRQALGSVEGREVDPLTAPWREVETGVIKLLGGAFNADDPTHGAIAFMIGSAWAGRVTRDLGAFWFPHRGAPGGAALGFPDAVVMISPLEMAVRALQRSQLTLLDDATADLREALSRERARVSLTGERPPAIGPDDYRRLFDPAYLQFVVLDDKASAAWQSTAADEAREIEQAIERLPADVPREMRESLRQQLVGALHALDGDKPIGQQVARAPQLLEVLAVLHGTAEQTGFAPAELWQALVLPLLHVGAAETFPEVDDEEKEAFRQGADPLAVYVEVLPYRTPAADEDGVLGVFPPETVGLVDPCFAGTTAVQLVRVDPAPIAELCAKLDLDAIRSSVERFGTDLRAKAGAEPPPAEGPGLLDITLALLRDLARAVRATGEPGRMLCLRRATEVEASSEPAIAQLRRVLRAPRIILA